MTKLRLLTLENTPILEQLQLEEALLRADDANWCVVSAVPNEAIVMGISGKQDEMIDIDVMAHRPVPVIRRFSGGGTVLVGQGTFCVSFILNADALNIPLQPKPILAWAASFYAQAFRLPSFHLAENDFALDGRKCGGNAKYLQKRRFLLHTAFLFDFDATKMDILKMPPKQPSYRQERSHADFLCPLKEYFASQAATIAPIVSTLRATFQVAPAGLPEARRALQRPHRRSTRTL